jgi:uncharacterized protein
MRLPPRFFLVALALLSAVAVVPAPAQAQFWGFGFGQQQPARRSGGFFSFPFFERGHRSPYSPYGAPYGGPVESSRAPPPRKLETPPARTIVVIGDSLADWLAYGLEEIYADQPNLGVVRKIRPNSGLIHYEPRNDTLEWSQAVKDILADDKPSAIVVMLGLNDRARASRRRTPATPRSRSKAGSKSPPRLRPRCRRRPAIRRASKLLPWPRGRVRVVWSNSIPSHGRSFMPSASAT